MELRDAIIARFRTLSRTERETYELTCGLFMIYLALPRIYEPGRGFNAQIWPDRIVNPSSLIDHSIKVVNVDWLPDYTVYIRSYRNGP